MPHRLHAIGLALLSFALGVAVPLRAVESTPAAEHAAKGNKYTAEVAKLAAAPAPAPGGVLLIGSSIFRKWASFAQDLAPLPVTNRAFGGSKTADQLVFFNQLVPSSHAGVVLWYCGSNDVNAKRPPELVLANTREWLALTRAALPKVRVVLVSVIRAPQKRDAGYLTQVDEINQGLQALASGSPDLDYVDVNPALETPEGEAATECYVADKLHLTLEGYRRMATVLKPVLTSRWKPAETH